MICWLCICQYYLSMRLTHPPMFPCDCRAPWHVCWMLRAESACSRLLLHAACCTACWEGALYLLSLSGEVNGTDFILQVPDITEGEELKKNEQWKRAELSWLMSHDWWMHESEQAFTTQPIVGQHVVEANRTWGHMPVNRYSHTQADWVRNTVGHAYISSHYCHNKS